MNTSKQNQHQKTYNKNTILKKKKYFLLKEITYNL